MRFEKRRRMAWLKVCTSQTAFAAIRRQRYAQLVFGMNKSKVFLYIFAMLHFFTQTALTHHLISSPFYAIISKPQSYTQTPSSCNQKTPTPIPFHTLPTLDLFPYPLTSISPLSNSPTPTPPPSAHLLADERIGASDWVYPSPLLSPLEAKLRSLLVELGREGKVVGAQVCIYKDGEVVVDSAAGVMGKYDPRPVLPSSLFSVFSATKGVTAALLHWLADRRWEHTFWPHFCHFFFSWPDFCHFFLFWPHFCVFLFGPKFPRFFFVAQCSHVCFFAALLLHFHIAILLPLSFLPHLCHFYASALLLYPNRQILTQFHTGVCLVPIQEASIRDSCEGPMAGIRWTRKRQVHGELTSVT